MPDFDISVVLNEVGESFTIIDVLENYDARGFKSNSEKEYSFFGEIQVNDGSEEDVKEGNLEKEDIIVFIDEDSNNISILKNGNIVLWNNTRYRIINTIHNDGHYELHAKKQ